ncbi:MAG TPA: hypothetical protein VGD58_22765 [Herpetosiphonaceae bacterium]
MSQRRVLLLGGPSNAGKSTLAAALAAQLGWRHISTDSLGRHPGRPWPSNGRAVPQHVVEHDLSLSPDDLFDAVLHHYQRLQPAIAALITMHATDPAADSLILEGSAIWPEFVAARIDDRVAAVWLTASSDLLRRRIYQASRIETTTGDEQQIIQKFLGRALRYNQHMLAAVQRLGLACIDVGSASSPDDLAQRCLEILRP